MAKQARKLSTEQNVSKVTNFHSFVDENAHDDSQKVAKLYDDWATYDQDVKKVAYNGPTIGGDMISKHCADKNVTILDVGSGTGMVGEELHSRGYTNITALDISQKSLDIARQKGAYSRVVLTDAVKEQMPFEANEFDVLVCVGCFIPGHLNQKCFPDWIRVTKSGGLIVLVMRESFLREGEFGNGQFDRAVQDLIDSKKWEKVDTRIYPEYFDDYDGVVFIYRVL